MRISEYVSNKSQANIITCTLDITGVGRELLFWNGSRGDISRFLHGLEKTKQCSSSLRAWKYLTVVTANDLPLHPILIVFFPSWGNFFVRKQLFLPNVFLALHSTCSYVWDCWGKSVGSLYVKGFIYTFFIEKPWDNHWRAELCNVYHLTLSISGHHRSRRLSLMCVFLWSNVEKKKTNKDQ